MDRLRVPRIFGARSATRLSRFEEGFLFRVSRAVPLGLAGVASAVLGLAALVLLYTLIPPRKVREPVPAAVPPQVAVSLADVQSHLKSQEPVPAPANQPGGVQTAPAEAPVDPGWLALARKVHAIRLLFPAPQYSWMDRYESYCVDLFMGYCYRMDQRLVGRGVASLVLSTVQMYDSGSQEEWISLPDVKEGYQLNVTDAARKVAALTELEGILKQVPVAQRRDILSGWTAVRQARESERLAQISRENERVASERAAEESRYATAQLRRTTLRGSSFSGILGAIASLWMLGLTLALLAIERNTRHLRGPAREPGRAEAQNSGHGALAHAGNSAWPT